MNLSQKVLALVLFPFVVQIFFLAVLALALTDAERETLSEARSKSLIADAHKLDYLFMESNSCVSQYISTRNPAFFKRLDELHSETLKDLQTLKNATVGNKSESEILTRVDKLLSQQYEFLTDLGRMIDEGGDELPLYRVGDLLQSAGYLARQTTAELNRFAEAEKQNNQKLPRSSAQARELVKLTLAAGVLLNLVLALSITSYFNRDTRDRLRKMMQNMQKLAERKPLAAPMAGRDEIAQVDQFFHRTAEELERLDLAKRDFFAMASHDLRTPLTTLHLFLGSLSQGVYGKLPGTAENRTRAMEQTAQRMIGLINNLLDIEKLEQGKLEIEPAAVDIADAIRQSTDSVRDLAEQRFIDIICPQTGAKVVADADKLVQVLVNLLSNAIKFSPEGGTVTISLEKQEGHMVKVFVSDVGPGIPDKHRALVFERFKQLQPVDGKRRPGTGLGLPVCHEIIKLHGGEIGVDSIEGKGSTFWFTLPMVAGSK